MKTTGYIREDHTKHLIVGLAIVVACAVLACLAAKTWWSIPVGAYAGWHLARAAAWLKEAHDLHHPETNTADPYDAEVTIAGASIGLAACVLTGAVAFAMAGAA